MSDIDFSGILTDYPIAGQDNDSQGFRDNFTAIYNAFETAKAEINALQTKAVLKANLSTNAVVSNDLNGSSIIDGFHNNFHGTSYSNDVSGPWEIDVRDGSLQNFTISDDIQFNFVQWPATGYFAKVRLHISSATDQFAVTFAQSAGVIRYDGEFPTPLNISAAQANTIFHVVEAWSYTGGAVVFLKYLGTFNTAGSNNKAFTGTLSVSGATTLAAASATGLTVTGSSTLAAVSATSLSLSTNATINGTIEVQGNSTLGNDKTADKVTFNSIPVFPSLTSTERDALISLVGMVLYNTTASKLQVCTTSGTGGSAVWQDLN